MKRSYQKLNSVSICTTGRSCCSAWHRGGGALPIWLLLLLMLLPAAVRAQYTCATNNGTITITGYTGLGGAVTVPSTINGLPVVSIGDFAFLDCFPLTSIVIPNSVTGIGSDAFAYCTNLASVTIGSSVSSIGAYAFSDCYKLTSIAIPNSVSIIRNDVFDRCTNLTSVTIGNSVDIIGNYAFYYCTSLKGVYFNGNAPLGVGNYMFEYDSNATVYYLPGTTGWSSTFGGPSAVLWNPQALTSDPSFGVRTNRFGFNITGTSNLVLVVEACTNLASHIWSPVKTNTLTNGSVYFSDPQWTNYPVRFYRFRSL